MVQPPWAIVAITACLPEDLDGDGVPAARDCNDGDPAQQLPFELFVDGDGDGFGGLTTDVGCAGSAWLVETADDCDDFDVAVFPGATEVGCDGRDNDCNPATVDGPAYTTGATWSTVQEALDRVGYQETVHLCGSTIHESVTAWRPATVEGAGPHRTILDGSGTGRATIELRAPVTLRGLTVTGGSGSPDPVGVVPTTFGGGIAAFDVEALVLDDVRVFENSADAGGGIAILGDTDVVATALRVNGNEADRGGGLYLEVPSARLDDTTIVGNVADVGGGVWLDGLLDGEGLQVVDNRADRGGGLHLQPNAVLWGQGTEILRNAGFRFGGGIHGAGVVREATVDDNLATTGAAVYGIGELTLDTVHASGNAASGDGGGLAVGPTAVVTVMGGSWVGNSAVHWGGGAHAALGRIELFDVLFDANIADVGAGLSCDQGTIIGEGVELRAGVAVALGGGFHSRCGVVELTDSVITANVAPDGAALRVDGGLTVLSQSSSDGAMALGLACEGGVLQAVELAADDADVITVGSQAPIPLPGPSFTCSVSSLTEGCAVP